MKGVCHYGSFLLPSGKLLCLVNDTQTGYLEDGQAFCQDNGFDRSGAYIDENNRSTVC